MARHNMMETDYDMGELVDAALLRFEDDEDTLREAVISQYIQEVEFMSPEEMIRFLIESSSPEVFRKDYIDD